MTSDKRLLKMYEDLQVLIAEFQAAAKEKDLLAKANKTAQDARTTAANYFSSMKNRPGAPDPESYQLALMAYRTKSNENDRAAGDLAIANQRYEALSRRLETDRKAYFAALDESVDKSLSV